MEIFVPVFGSFVWIKPSRNYIHGWYLKLVNASFVINKNCAELTNDAFKSKLFYLIFLCHLRDFKITHLTDYIIINCLLMCFLSTK